MARDLAREELLELLAAAPVRLRAATQDVPDADLARRPAPEEWSAVEVLAHLRACSDVWGDCLRRILAEDAPTIRAVNPRTWMESTDYVRLDFSPSFRAFEAQRAELLAELGALPAEAWSRDATVTGAGRTLHPTVHSYVVRLATHERAHVKQVERTVQAPTRTRAQGSRR